MDRGRGVRSHNPLRNPEKAKMAKMDEYEFIRSQLCAALHCVPACDPLCEKDWKRASKGRGGWRDRGAGPWFKNHYCCITHASTHADMHARIGSHLRASLRTIRCVICYSAGVRQIRTETVMAIRISSAEVGSEFFKNLKKSTPRSPNVVPRGSK